MVFHVAGGRRRPLIAAACRRTPRIVGLAVALGMLLSLALPTVEAYAAATPTFVQTRAQEVNSGTTNSLAFNSANTAGNLIVAYVIWSNTSPVTLSDSKGNSYVSAAGRTTWGSSWSSQVFYAKAIAGGTQHRYGLVQPVRSAAWAVLYIHEYSGVDKIAPVDTTATATGSSSAMNSGSLTTSFGSDLLFNATASSNTVTSGGTGYTTRSTASGNRIQDRNVTSAGSYSADAVQNGTGWVSHLVAFKADSGSSDNDAADRRHHSADERPAGE